MQALNQTIEKLEKLPYISKILIAGSMAEGSYTESSDIDLVIVSDVLPPQDRSLSETVRSFHPAIDPFFFNKEEYEELIKKKKLIALTAKVVFRRNP
jgi:predicted nucleotidyltransferase